MHKTSFRCQLFIGCMCIAGALARQTSAADPMSDIGLHYYAQGGVVVDGIAYFTSTDGSHRADIKKSEAFPSVVAFDVRNFRTVKRYPFSQTYDSSPLVIQKSDGVWLVVAHEHRNSRSVAMNRDTARVEWISAANQPGRYFFGYSYYRLPDGSKLILAAAQNGLHAISIENGKELWRVAVGKTGAITPCVDQEQGWIFYQAEGIVMKIRAADGKVLKAIDVDSPKRCISWNTVLAKDSHGYHVATRWYGPKGEWDSGLRVYDADLNLLWEKTGLPIGKKDTLTYVDGILLSGCGNGWIKNYGGGDTWKYIDAYSIRDGRRLWRCDLRKYDFKGILNIPYFNGYFYAETQGERPGWLFRINAADGKLEQAYEYGRPITSCAPCILAHGMMLSGDLYEDRIVATRIAENLKADWPGPFCDPQTLTFALPDDKGAVAVPMREVPGTRPASSVQFLKTD